MDHEGEELTFEAVSGSQWDTDTGFLVLSFMDGHVIGIDIDRIAHWEMSS